MILKYALKYACFVAVVLYGTMTLNLISRLWNQNRMKHEQYQITNFSELELKTYDAHQVSMLQDFVTITEENTTNTALTDSDTNPKKETRNLKWLKGRKDLAENTDDDLNDDKFTEVGKISVFSAHYDNRDKFKNPVVRIIGLMNEGSTENLVCGFHESVKSHWILAEKHEMCENHGKLYGGYMFNCMIPANMKVAPKKVYLHSLTSISEQIRLNTSIAVVLDVKRIRLKQVKRKTSSDKEGHNNETDAEKDYMTNEKKSQENLKIGVCVSPMYGKINLSNLIQFIELLKLQGVNHIIMYKTIISKSVQILLDYYQTKGYITVVNWTLPHFIQTNQIWYHGQIIMIQDCLYRTMGNYDYLAFLDLDEAIIPRLDYHWSDLIHRLEFLSIRDKSNDLTAGFSFKSAYFDPDHQENQADNFQKLSFLNALKRNAVLSHRRTKLIVKPEMVKEMGIHHVSSTIDLTDQTENVTIYDVSDDIGLIHHFKGCSTQLDPNMNCDNSTEDKSILKYSQFLREQYNDVLRHNLKYFKTVT